MFNAFGFILNRFGAAFNAFECVFKLKWQSFIALPSLVLLHSMLNDCELYLFVEFDFDDAQLAFRLFRVGIVEQIKLLLGIQFLDLAERIRFGIGTNQSHGNFFSFYGF